MAREDDLLALTSDLYDAAMDPTLWPQALDGFSRLFGGVGAVMHSLTRERTLLHVSPDLIAATHDYQAYWWNRDPLIEVGRAKRMKSGTFVDKAQLDPETIQRGAFYQEFLRSHGVGGIVGVLASPVPDTTISFSLQNPAGHEMDAADLKLFESVGGHLTRAAAISAKVVSLETLRDSLFEGYDRYGCGLAIVAADGAVLASNREFQALIGLGIRLYRQKIATENPAQQHALDRMIADIANGGRLTPDTAVIVLERAASEHGLVIRAIPLRPQTIEARFPGVPTVDAVLLFVVDPDRSPPGGPGILRRAFGLTGAQARTADLLASGLTPQEIADTLEISITTVRTTLKVIYDKLGVSRQVDLARLVARVRPLDGSPNT